MMTQYITSSIDRWDTVAYKAYGDPTMIEPIINANKGIPLTPVIPQGLSLNVPIITVIESTVTENIPPWKR